MSDADDGVSEELLEIFGIGPTLENHLLLVQGRDGVALWVCDGLLALLGYSRNEFDQGAIDWDLITPPEYWPLEDHCAGLLIRGDMTVCQYVKEFVAKDGARVPVRIQVAHSLREPEKTISLIAELVQRKM